MGQSLPLWSKIASCLSHSAIWAGMQGVANVLSCKPWHACMQACASDIAMDQLHFEKVSLHDVAPLPWYHGRPQPHSCQIFAEYIVAI